MKIQKTISKSTKTETFDELEDKRSVESSDNSKVIKACNLREPKSSSVYCSTSSLLITLNSIEEEMGENWAIKQGLYDLHLRGNIAQYSQTQAGSLFLQKHIDKLEKTIIALLYQEVSSLNLFILDQVSYY